MTLHLAVEAGDELQAVSIDLDAPLTFAQTQRVFELCGSVDPLTELAEWSAGAGEWNEEAARAIVFVKLEAQLPELQLDWQQFSVDFGMPDAELEAGIPIEDL